MLLLVGSQEAEGPSPLTRPVTRVETAQPLVPAAPSGCAFQSLEGPVSWLSAHNKARVELEGLGPAPPTSDQAAGAGDAGSRGGAVDCTGPAAVTLSHLLSGWEVSGLGSQLATEWGAFQPMSASCPGSHLF